MQIRLQINGIRSPEAAILKARFRNQPLRLMILGARSDTWFAANLDNPFRDWADDDQPAGAAACKAYANALRAISRLPAASQASADGAAEPLHALVARLNAIDAKHSFIDTIRREEAGDAFIELAARAGVTDEVAQEWFDKWREF